MKQNLAVKIDSFRLPVSFSSSGNLLFYLLVILVLFPACAGKMSVEEAKQVTVSMSGEAFVPPPRRIDDILSILEQPGEFDKEITEKHRAKADQRPPKTENPKKLYPFYVERGQAALQLRRWNQALQDFRIALYYSKKAKIRDSWLLDRIGSREIYFGNVNRGIDFLHQSLRDQKRVTTYYHLEPISKKI